MLPKNGLSRHSSSLLLYKKVRFEGKKSKVQNTTFQYHIPYHSERINKWYKYRYYTGKASSLLMVSLSRCEYHTKLVDLGQIYKLCMVFTVRK